MLALLPPMAQAMSTKGECMLRRQYMGKKNIMQHLSMDELAGEAQTSKGACSAACKRAAKTVPIAHQSQLRATETVKFLCMYDHKQTGQSSPKPTFQAEAPLKKLKMEKKAKNSYSKGTTLVPRVSHNKQGTTLYNDDGKVGAIIPPNTATSKMVEHTLMPGFEAPKETQKKKRSMDDYLKPGRAYSPRR